MELIYYYTYTSRLCCNITLDLLTMHCLVIRSSLTTVSIIELLSSTPVRPTFISCHCLCCQFLWWCSSVCSSCDTIRKKTVTCCSAVDGVPAHVSFYPRDAMLARVIAIATCLSVCPSVCVSVTRRYCVKTKKASGMISSPSGSPKTSFLTPNFITKFQGLPPERGPQIRVGRKNSAIF